MARRPSISRRLTTAARWPLGVSLTSWRYMWRTTPMRRLDLAGSLRRDAPPPLPAGVELDELQLPEEGFGALLHRLYRVRVRDARLTPEELFARVQGDPDRAAASEFATFQKVRGDPGRLEVGDELVVRMAAPWDGPVRVVDVTPTSHRFATMQGHLEAGQIEFCGSLTQEGELVLTIEAWARSGDRFSQLAFHRLRMAKEIQVHMWVSYLERLVEGSGGRRSGLLEVRTRRVEESELGGGPWPPDDRLRRRLESVRARPVNFDPQADGPLTPDNGWDVDHYCRELAAEPPGPPAAAGSWEAAREIMREYRFADPSVVRAHYDPSRPLEERDMLLVVRFLGLRFPVGVRVGEVVDEERTLEGRRVRVWGWSYRTLQGHLEAGEMGYEVWKWLDTGTVQFRVHRVVRSAGEGNPVVRLGFRLFGRREQVRFARRALRRTAELVDAALEESPDARRGGVADELTDRASSNERAGAELGHA